MGSRVERRQGSRQEGVKKKGGVCYLDELKAQKAAYHKFI